jgi:hypothetical protein
MDPKALGDLWLQLGIGGFFAVISTTSAFLLVRRLLTRQEQQLDQQNAQLTAAAMERKEAHDKFTVTVERQGDRHERIITDMGAKFMASLERQGGRIDQLTERVDDLDHHVRGK